MQKLTQTEWARTRDRITTLSLPSSSPAARARMLAWLEARQSAGWFYVMTDNFHFGSSFDADAFRQWIASGQLS